MTPLLRRLPPAGQLSCHNSTRYCEVTDAWAGQTVVCIATGTSLTAEQVARTRCGVDLDGRKVFSIAINDAYTLAPWADMLYFADAGKNDWLSWHRDRPAFKAFAGQKCMIDVDAEHLRREDEVFLLKHAGAEGLSSVRTGITTGSNTGHQALNIAGLARPALILMLGYDAHPGPDKKVHFFGQHPDRSLPPFNHIIKAMSTLQRPMAALGIRVVNCTPGSAIDCFERGDIASFLPDPRPAVVPAPGV